MRSYPMDGVTRVGCGVRGVDRGGLRAARLGGAGGGAAVNVDNIVGLVLVVGLAVYMIAALLFPERF